MLKKYVLGVVGVYVVVLALLFVGYALIFRMQTFFAGKTNYPGNQLFDRRT